MGGVMWAFTYGQAMYIATSLFRQMAISPLWGWGCTGQTNCPCHPFVRHVIAQVSHQHFFFGGRFHPQVRSVAHL